MQFGILSDNVYLLRLEKGEEVHAILLSFCEKKQIKNGSLLGLGSIENPTLAHYRVDTKKYSEQSLMGIFEVTNLTGTVGLYEDKPLVHIHMGLSDQEMKGFGGHLVKGVVSATLEIVLTSYPSSYSKSHSDAIGLKLFDLPDVLD